MTTTFRNLTEHQRYLLELTAKGSYSSAEVADLVGSTPAAVAADLRALCRVFDVRTAAALLYQYGRYVGLGERLIPQD